MRWRCGGDVGDTDDENQEKNGEDEEEDGDVENAEDEEEDKDEIVRRTRKRRR